jgi:hypothetical protein
VGAVIVSNQNTDKSHTSDVRKFAYKGVQKLIISLSTFSNVVFLHEFSPLLNLGAIMTLVSINFVDVMNYFKEYQHQIDALEWLGNNLTQEQLAGFYVRWYNELNPSEIKVMVELTNHFPIAYKFTKQWEGGFVDHPEDPGGRTNLGITQNTYDAWAEKSGTPSRDVYYLTQEIAEKLYLDEYWLAGNCHRMDLCLAVAHFDTCVNFGVYGATQFLQEAIGVGADGQWGQITEAAFQRQNNYSTAIHLVEGRINYRYSRVAQNPSQDVFLDGWLNRDEALESYIKSLDCPKPRI